MNIHLKILLLSIISLILLFIAKALELSPGPDILTRSMLWYVLWGGAQLLLFKYSFYLLTDYKHRSSRWSLLVLFFGVLGIIYIYLIPKKKTSNES